MSAIATVLLGSAVTAFGVAPLTATPPDSPPTRQVVQALQPEGLAPQVAALDLSELVLHRSDTTRSGDTADSLLRRLGISDAEAATFLRSNAVAAQMLTGRAGKLVHARLVSEAGGGRLQQLVVKGPAADSQQHETHFTRLTIERTAAGLVARSEQAELQRSARVGSGTIESTLFAAADDAGLPDAVTSQLAEMFGADIDFRRELRRGDTFAAVYETRSADGEPVPWTADAGRVLAARFVNRDKLHEAIWFQEEGGRGGYFAPDGSSKVRGLLASPLAFSRVTSGFAMRFHPIQKTWRAHLGVDYGAPTGTPVRAVGDGVVEFSGVQNGYGNVVVLKHRDDRSTVYAHLSRIDVNRGASVAQGATIGAVGSTGWATGPHLHFEFKVKGQQVDPVQIARSSETVTLSAASRARFKQTAALAMDRLDATRSSPATLGTATASAR
ncbi:M23 family metallopeptidase [Sphaerotilus hippei]|nr:M23 family metallopeptidase [Sphaerotilus hippei]